MATLLITAKPRFMPDDDNLGKWEVLPNIPNFYYQKVGQHHVFIHECLPSDGKKPKSKHKIVANWVDVIITYSKEHFDDFFHDDFFLIAHDEDLIRYRKNDEGLLREAEVKSVHGGLEGKINDKNIYIFMHSIQHDMFETLVKKLSVLEINNIELAIRVIKGCTHETSVS